MQGFNKQAWPIIGLVLGVWGLLVVELVDLIRQPAQAQAILSRRDVIIAVKQALRETPSLDRADVEAAVRLTLQKCSFRGREVEESQNEADTTDFVIDVIC